MAGTLTLSSWPGTTGDPSISYFDHYLEQFQYRQPDGVIPSLSGDLYGDYSSELLVYGDSSGLQVKVNQGRVNCKGLFAKIADADVSGGVYTLTVSAAHGTLARVDRVVVEFDLTTGAATLKMSNGTAATAGTEVPPALTQSSTVWQIPLALVLVDAAATTVAVGDVIDVRQFSYTTVDLMRALIHSNAVINGGMEVWNEGTSFAAAANGQYLAEMFVISYVSSTGVVTCTQDTDVPAVAADFPKESYSIKVDVTTADASVAAGEGMVIRTCIEGYRAKRSLQRGFTFSFWVKAVKTGVNYVSFTNSGGDRCCVMPYFIEAANTWQRVHIRVPAAPSAGTWSYTNGTGLRIDFNLQTGSTFHLTANSWQTTGAMTFRGAARQTNHLDNTANNFWVAGVGPMLPGMIAFDFAGQDYEESLCRRYYQKFIPAGVFGSYAVGQAVDTTTAYFNLPFEPKRTTPTLVFPAVSRFSIQYLGSLTTATAIAGSVGMVALETTRIDVTATGTPLTAGQAVRLIDSGANNSSIGVSARMT